MSRIITVLRKSKGIAVIQYTALLVLACLAFPLKSFAAEMVTNGNYNTSASWTLAGTATGAVYDAGNTNTADGSGSIYVLTPVGKNNTETGTITQTGLSIPAGSEITNASDVVAFTKHTVLAGNTKNHSIIIEVNDGGWVEVYSATPTDNQPWTSLANATATVFPYTVLNGITDVRVTITAANGNNAASQNQLWVDDVSITYTAAVPCTYNDPTVTITTTNQTITTDGGSANYTVSITNNNSASCADETFSFTATDSNSTNFNASTAPSNITLASGANSTVPLLVVNAKPGETSGTNDTYVTSSSTNTANVNSNTRTTTLNVCTYADPTVTITTTNQTITTDGGSANYTVSITNNNTAACADETFSFTATDSNSTNFNASTAPSNITLASGANSSVPVLVVNAKPGETSGTNNTYVTSSSANTANVNSNTRTTTLDVSNNMITNGIFNGTGGWTLAGTATGAVYDAGNTNTADGSGSIYVLTVADRNQTETGTITQSGLSIPAGSEITNASDVVAYTMHSVLSGNTKAHSITIEVNDGGWVEVYSATPTDNQPWTYLANATATTFPYTVVNGITDVRITITAQTGNTNGSQNQLWVDDVFITYSLPAGCIYADPTVTITTTNQTITSDGGSANYTVSITNNNSGGCADETFSFTATDSNLTNFNASTAPSNITLADGANSTVPILVVNAKPGQTSGTNDTYVTSSSANTANVNSNTRTTTLSVGGGCTYADPTVTITTTNQAITSDGGSANYTVSITNNNSGGCADETFSFTATDTNSTNFNASTAPSNITLADGANSTVPVLVVNAKAGETSGSNDTYVTSSSTNTANVNSNTRTTTISIGGPDYTVTTCSDCHDYPPKDGTARNTPEGAVLGSHSTHVKKVGVLCVECHGNTTAGETVLAHRNTFIQFTANLKNGGSYSKGTSFAQVNDPVLGTCTAYCHGTNMGTGAEGAVAAPTWGNSATVYCGSCHKELQTNMTQGSHAKHLTSPNNINCFFCHASNLATTHVNASVTFKDTSTLTTTSVCASCHNGGAPEAKFDWYSTVATQTCDTCHLTTGDVDDFAYTNLTSPTKVIAKIDSTEFTNRGHGKISGTYPYTGNPAANKVCANCHDSTVNHNDGTKAYRTLWSGDPDTFCLSCHGSGAELQGAYATITGIQNHSRTNIQNAGYNNVTTWRFTPKCIDCHDPHGDNNIGMIHNKIFTGGSNALGIPNPFVNASTVIFTKYTGTNSFGTDSGTTNVCEVCHSRTAFHRLDHSTANHNSGLDCTACHDHKAGWAPLGGDCKTCHGQAQTGVYNPRQIVGAGGDFVKLSRHVNDGTSTEIVTNYDCAVCHAEGDITEINAGTGWRSQTYHNDGSTSTDRMVSLRNVDDITAAPFEFNKNIVDSVGESMRTAMDNFCLGCHDSDGASDITVNSTNDGLDTGVSVTRNLTPFNTNDAVTNGNDLMGTRTRVVDVKSQFYAGTGGSGSGYNGNPSQHAVLGARYSTKHSDSNAGQWDTLAWTDHVYRNGSVANVAKETATLHCSDCHLSESNAHGAVNAWYMLQSGTPNDYTTDYAMEGIVPKNDVATSTDIGESIVCWKCHSPAAYAGNGINDATISRTDHSDDAGGWFDVGNFGGKAGSGAYLGPACLVCHAGDGFGHIHGRGSSTDGDNGQYTPNGGTGSFTKYRFMPGAWNSWQPGTDDTAWNGPKTGDTGCYLPASSSWTACGQHSNGSKTGNAATINYARPVKY